MLKLYINLDRSTDRRERMEREFPEFERFEAVDGKTLGESPTHKECPLSSNEIACAMSHTDALSYFLDGDHHHLVLLEDDVSTVPRIKDFGLELKNMAVATRDTIDILFLFSPKDHPRRISLHPGGHVKWVRSHMGVMYTRAGAQAALEAMQPIYYMHDIQVFGRICKSRTKPVWFPDDMPELPQIEMRGLFKGLVKLNELSKESTIKPGKTRGRAIKLVR